MGPIKGWWENKKRERADRRAVEDWVDETMARERAERKRRGPRVLKVGVVGLAFVAMLSLVGCNKTLVLERFADGTPRVVLEYDEVHSDRQPITDMDKACAFWGTWMCPGSSSPKEFWWHRHDLHQFIGYEWGPFVGGYRTRIGGYWVESWGDWHQYLTCERITVLNHNPDCDEPYVTGARG